MNIKSPYLEIVDSSEGNKEVKCLFEAVEDVNHGLIAYQALQRNFLGGLVSRIVGYCFMNNIIWLYSLKRRKILAKIHFPAPVDYQGCLPKPSQTFGNIHCKNE